MAPCFDTGSPRRYKFENITGMFPKPSSICVKLFAVVQVHGRKVPWCLAQIQWLALIALELHLVLWLLCVEYGTLLQQKSLFDPWQWTSNVMRRFQLGRGWQQTGRLSKTTLKHVIVCLSIPPEKQWIRIFNILPPLLGFNFFRVPGATGDHVLC